MSAAATTTTPTDNNNNNDTSPPTHTCAVCSKPAGERCSRCRSVWYCSRPCQVQAWKGGHKQQCAALSAVSDVKNNSDGTDQYTLHKKEFDRIVKHYRLDTEEQSEAIAACLTQHNNSISAGAFAERFGMTNAEAVVFLEWIKVGVKFKEEAIDAAKKSGFSGGKR